MLQTLVWMEKVTAMHHVFSDQGMLIGMSSSYMAGIWEDQRPFDSSNTADDIEEDKDDDDGGAVPGDPTTSLFVVNLTAKSCMSFNIDQCLILILIFIKVESSYPQDLKKLTAHILHPQFPLTFCQFLFTLDHPNQLLPLAIDNCPQFGGEIKVYHSAVATFYALSNLCRVGSMHHE